LAANEQHFGIRGHIEIPGWEDSQYTPAVLLRKQDAKLADGPAVERANLDGTRDLPQAKLIYLGIPSYVTL